jgi:hypothetical protein
VAAEGGGREGDVGEEGMHEDGGRLQNEDGGDEGKKDGRCRAFTGPSWCRRYPLDLGLGEEV